MNQQTKDKWLAALRSDKYRQGQSKLKSATLKYCCLGVLAEECGIPSHQFAEGESFRFTFSKEHSSHSYLPYTMLDELTQMELARMNDNGVDFPTIADWIEKNVPVTS